MITAIKNIKDLPSWFDLAKYEATSELDAAGWYEQLAVRKSLLELVTNDRLQGASLMTNH